MRTHAHRAPSRGLVPLLLGLVVASCAAEPPPVVPTKPRAPEDDWQRSAIWLHATSDAKGGASQECDHVLGRLEEEAVCKGLLCQDAAHLATEWLEKCAANHAATVADVKALETSFQQRGSDPPSACSQELDELLRDGCSVSGCAQRAQAWLTQCAESEAGPLAVSKLVRTVERAVGPDEELVLDTRSCAALAKAVQAGAHCKDEPSCGAIGPELDAYSTRCLSTGETPTLETGLAMMAVTIGTGTIPEPIFVKTAELRIKPEQFPLTLADASGAVLSVCGRRMVDRAEYLAARERCPGSPLVLVHLDVLKGGSRQLHIGQLPVPDSATMARLYPSLLVTGEREPTLAAELDAARSDFQVIVAAGSSATAAQLVGFVERHAEVIARSDELRATMSAADASLTGLFRQLGEAKVAQLRGSRDALRLRGVLHRGQRRALADIAADGSAVIGGTAPAGRLGTSSIWPAATSAHGAALVALERALKLMLRPSDALVDEQLDRARVQASACGVAETARLAAERDLRACVFDSCDESRREELAQTWDRAVRARDTARAELDLALSSLESTPEESQITAIEACQPPR